MLVITRRVGERIRIGPSVIVTAQGSGSGAALLEIITPLSITILPEGLKLQKESAAPETSESTRRLEDPPDAQRFTHGESRPPVSVMRAVDESLRIGSEIEVMVVSAKNDVVKLGVKAPRHVQVLREEVFERIAEETAAAAAAKGVPEIPDELRRLMKPKEDEE